ncbi:MAG: glutamate 5-kinase [Nitrospiraceae bacterium]|nr:glutamate 5-kinase [Nitrospiraceae bacterium]
MRLVIKIGSNILAPKGVLDENRMRSIASDIARISAAGHEAVLVSSGAVAAGIGKLGLKKKPSDIQLKQAVAAVGQSALMWAYEKVFGETGKKVAQILLTRDVFTDRARYINSRNTIITLLGLGVIPVINENDTVSVEEIKFGDNDHLAALVASLVEADRLVILSDVDGLYPADPKQDPDARIIPLVTEITPQMEKLAGGAGSAVGTGGMYSKILAAKKAMGAGITVNIINGRKHNLLIEILEGRACGTEFRPGNGRLSARKGWIAYGLKAKGRLIIDEGAKEALLSKGKSLLPSGIVSVEGSFDKGDPVYCISPEGERIAKGLSNYSAWEIEKIRGRKTSEIEVILGYRYSDEVIHRDNLVLTKHA